MKVQILIDMAKYKHVDLTVEEALKLIDSLREILGKDTPDLAETVRYLKNFDEFYEFMRKKFKDYISPPKKPDDYIKGDVVVDKVKLYKNDEGVKRVVIVFDRRVDIKLIEEALRRIGYKEVEVKKLL